MELAPPRFTQLSPMTNLLNLTHTSLTFHSHRTEPYRRSDSLSRPVPANRGGGEFRMRPGFGMGFSRFEDAYPMTAKPSLRETPAPFLHVRVFDFGRLDLEQQRIVRRLL
jgi:hypothetical protein